MKNSVVYCSFLLILLVLYICIPALVFGADASDNNDYRLTHIARAAGGHMYALTDRHGALLSKDRGSEWRSINEGLPLDQVWPFEENTYRRFTSLSLDTHNKKRIAATTSSSLYVSKDAGRAWKEISLKYPVKSKNYLTAVSFDPLRPERIYLGTSFNGLFISNDGGASWKKESDFIDELYRGAGFYEEITDLAMVPEHPDELFIASVFDNLIFRYNTESHEVVEIEMPEESENILSINNYNGGVTDEPALEVHFEGSRGIYNLKTREWNFRPPLLRSQIRTVLGKTSDSLNRNTEESDTHRDVRALYLNAYNVTDGHIDEHISFMKEHGFNGIVVDVKDDWGRLTYGSKLDRPKEIGAVHTIFDIAKLLEKAHAEGIYVIGRMVVFKDKRLYQAEDNKYALWDVQQNAPWAHTVPEKYEEEGEEKTRYVQREFWTDPFSEGVWDYNIEIAEELESLGIDEIQFDYIRFPSDGDLSTARYRFRKPGMLKTEAIESFVKKAAEDISIPISVDLYGFNSWYRMGNWIGQDIGMLAEYVDIICPMYYPSHFPFQFLSRDNYIHRAYELYKIGTQRAQKIVGPSTSIRPYVQAFLMGHELSMEEPEYFNYLNRQLEGIVQAQGGGYTLWNNMNKYYMVNGRVSELNQRLLDSDKKEEREKPDQTL